MATCYRMARSNYFRVKDKKAFREFLETFSGVELIEDEEGRVGFVAPEGIPIDFVVDEKTGEDDHVDFVDELSGHLVDGEVAIIQEIGWEKMRYLMGYATAINNKLEKRNVDLCDIYAQAKELTNKPHDVTAAEY